MLHRIAPCGAVNPKKCFDKFGKEIRVQKSLGENGAEQWSLKRNI
jgi:hypothetical protein